LGQDGAARFQQVPYDQLSGSVLCCIEQERLEFEMLEVRTRGQYLTRLRRLTREEPAEWDRREGKALARLADHDLEHRCGG
jgi:hypothetical protein